MRIVVYGLWHLGCVTTACMAEASGHHVVALDLEPTLVDRLKGGRPPLEEPGLAELLEAGRRAGRLTFTSDPAAALEGADVLWVAFDSPVDEQDRADVNFVRERLERVRDFVPPGTLVLISSQVPVGFTRSLANDWAGRGLRFGYSPENLRIGRAIDAFRNPDRVVVGLSHVEQDREVVTRLLAHLGTGGSPPLIEWMTLESSEMTKHALNAFLATSVTFINELARLCEVVGADAKEVERGLKSEGRVGPRAYLGPGAAFTGGTLARDLQFLAGIGAARQIGTPLLSGVLASNALHLAWAREKVERLIADVAERPPVVAVLGLAYMPGTDRLTRSAGPELCRWLQSRGVRVRAYDPAVAGGSAPPELAGSAEVCGSATDALAGADLAVVATEWPAFRKLTADDVARAMRRPRVLDQNWYLAANLGSDPRVTYEATGRRGGAK